jgi:large subunit ribosomal protein L9
MEVILLQDTDYGDKGSVVKVADGFARNYLVPNKLAVIKTAGAARHFNELSLHQKKKLEKEKALVEAMAQKINTAEVIVLKAKGRESGQLFGSITHQQIAEAINEKLKINVDRRRIMLKQIKDAGLFEVPIRLTFGIAATAKIKVELEIEKKEEAQAEEGKKKRKPRKKEEILAELEPEAAVEKSKVPAAEMPVAAEEPKPEKKTRAKKAKTAE